MGAWLAALAVDDRLQVCMLVADPGDPTSRPIIRGLSQISRFTRCLCTVPQLSNHQDDPSAMRPCCNGRLEVSTQRQRPRATGSLTVHPSVSRDPRPTTNSILDSIQHKSVLWRLPTKSATVQRRLQALSPTLRVQRTNIVNDRPHSVHLPGGREG